MFDKKSSNITKHGGEIDRSRREQNNGHEGKVLWLTGLSGSGKSTIARAVEVELFEQGKQVYVLDGDNIRHGLNGDLGFSAEDREENLRRITEVAALLADAGFIVLASFIAPYKEVREKIRTRLAKDYVEVYVKCSLEKCEERDVKGLYAKARAGEIKGFTGIDDRYDEPKNAEIVLDAEKKSLQECVQEVVDYLDKHL